MNHWINGSLDYLRAALSLYIHFYLQESIKSIDVNKLPICLKRVRPIEKQKEFESRRYRLILVNLIFAHTDAARDPIRPTNKP